MSEASNKDLRMGFVLHEGFSDESEGELRDIFPSMYFKEDDETEEELKQEALLDFDSRLHQGLATTDRGLYLVQIEDITKEQLDKLDDYEEVQKIIRNNWAGYNTSLVHSRKSSPSDWLEGSFDDDNNE